ncbi:restriction endonuclease [Caballeronia grimmiae]|uniref:Restriction endonuclease type IV Mrr domain-containing protein n=1 Tax=Caballeronia grimmiae TaxID=1071679 RepID=A0A069P677_9BURK|nr:restriction endonuclease [Caballeronia grimmiae]KDR35987.1 hypothetical protein BG57_24425 [Caballeronia grimmiae]GGD86023.1 hypothetical protein GCM10010985_45750 [Caballeronia grimmiae]
MKDADVIARLEDTIGIDGAPRRLREALEHEFVASFGMAPIAAAEKAEQTEARIAKKIASLQADAESSGTPGVLSVLEHPVPSVSGACRIHGSDSPQVAQAKRHRLNIDPLYRAIRAITPNDFEQFGARVLTEMGATEVRVTRRSNDQGIDFFGILNLGRLQSIPGPFFKLVHDVELRFAGQAKHYPNASLSTSVIREMVGAMSLARYGTFSSDINIFEPLALKPFNPLLALIFTTGTISSGAIRLAERAGVIARNGTQLATFLADRGVSMVPSAQGPTFDPAAFRTWLNGPT